MLKRSECLKANQFVIVLNWVKNKEWEGKDIKQSFNDTIDYIHYEGQYTIVELDITLEDCKKYLIELLEQYTTNINALQRDIKKHIATYVQPKIKTVKEYFIHNELPFRTVTEYQRYLNNNVLPIIGEK
jgi:hypothetical protein